MRRWAPVAPRYACDMQVRRNLEQHIAVFGESGSGKTVLLSSFYGATQQPQYAQDNPFYVLPDDVGQGNSLYQKYLGMKNAAKLPEATRFSVTPYSFSLKLKDGADARATRNRPFDALRLVWHDYPGEWFEQATSGPEEAQRRTDAFRSLLGSDVALLLVDGQRLLDNGGEEERYLKSLFTNFRNGLLSLKDDLLDHGRPLIVFPRIWIVALTKSDLFPTVDVNQFRDLIVEKACDEINELRNVIVGLVAGAEALSVGEDFLLLSSAKFEPGKIDVTRRVGVDLILPLAAMLPFERHVRWAQAKEVPGKVAENLLGGVHAVAAALVGRKRKPGAVGFVASLVGLDLVNDAVRLVGEKLRQLNADAVAKHDSLRITLTRFKLELEDGEQRRVLLRSRR